MTCCYLSFNLLLLQPVTLDWEDSTVSPAHPTTTRRATRLNVSPAHQGLPQLWGLQCALTHVSNCKHMLQAASVNCVDSAYYILQRWQERNMHAAANYLPYWLGPVGCLCTIIWLLHAFLTAFPPTVLQATATDMQDVDCV